jgi:hypothetical protein
VSLCVFSRRFNYADVRSDYVSITNDADRVTELIKDIGLDSKWKLDEVMVSAIAFILKK